MNGFRKLREGLNTSGVFRKKVKSERKLERLEEAEVAWRDNVEQEQSATGRIDITMSVDYGRGSRKLGCQRILYAWPCSHRCVGNKNQLNLLFAWQRMDWFIIPIGWFLERSKP